MIKVIEELQDKVTKNSDGIDRRLVMIIVLLFLITIVLVAGLLEIENQLEMIANAMTQ